MDNIKPELLVLIPVLNIIGAMAKSKGVKSANIPVILGVVGVLLSVAYVFAFFGGESVLRGVVTGVVQGVLVAGAAVYGHQVFKQIKNNKEEKNDE